MNDDEPETTPSAPPVPLLHPVALAAVAVLAINDHWLKEAWPGVVTGKLSDVAGLVFFPLLLLAMLQLLGATRFARSSAARLGCVGLTGLVFGAIQVLPEAAEMYRHGLGWLQWPVLALLDGARFPQPVAHTMDSTDLLALPALLVPWLLASPKGDRRQRSGSLALAAVAVFASGCGGNADEWKSKFTSVEMGTVTSSRLHIDLTDESLRKRFDVRRRQLPDATLELHVYLDLTLAEGASSEGPSIVSSRVRWEGPGEPSPWEDVVIDASRPEWSSSFSFDLSNDHCTTTRCEGELVIENEWHHGTVGRLDAGIQLSLSITYGEISESEAFMVGEELQWVETE
ncbi:MAG: hypothetical protein AAF799_16325 [Myxococcota bacterium]